MFAFIYILMRPAAWTTHSKDTTAVTHSQSHSIYICSRRAILIKYAKLQFSFYRMHWARATKKKNITYKVFGRPEAYFRRLLYCSLSPLRIRDTHTHSLYLCKITHISVSVRVSANMQLHFVDARSEHFAPQPHICYNNIRIFKCTVAMVNAFVRMCVEMLYDDIFA